jgi:hypothetical protein
VRSVCRYYDNAGTAHALVVDREIAIGETIVVIYLRSNPAYARAPSYGLTIPASLFLSILITGLAALLIAGH